MVFYSIILLMYLKLFYNNKRPNNEFIHIGDH